MTFNKHSLWASIKINSLIKPKNVVDKTIKIV